ncbi:LysR family transcriptional regulator substrate-binding protein [Thermodesulfobacteriota bacterium]
MLNNSFSASKQISLKIGCTPTAAIYILSPLIKTFHEKQPNIRINLLQRSSSQLIGDIVNSVVDIAISIVKKVE